MRLPADAEIEAHVLSLAPVRDGIADIARQVEAECTGLAYERAFDQGTYAAMIRSVPTEGAAATIRAEDKKSEWLEEGTGIFGPKRQPIRPKKGKFLVFRVREPGSAPKAGMSGKLKESGLIFAKEVKGRPASWVMRDGSKAVAHRLGLRWRNLRDFQG